MEKFSLKSLLIIIVLLLIGITGLWQIQRRASPAAAWFNDSWQYRKAITIGNTGSQISNAQVQVLTDYDISSLVSAGKIGSSLNDIRFTDINGQLLHYWIQDYTNNSTNIWVLIPKLLSGTQKIYMYYGNSSAKENSESHWVADLGGTISSFNGYRIHAFLNNDTYTNLVDRQADVLVIAGGGGGGRRHGAGGGAGGLIYQTNFNITSDIGVTVGAGGLGATSVQNSQNGSNSTFSSLTAIGGGFGGSYDASRDGASGGSGGGSTTLNVAVGTVGQGNSGGTGYTASSPYNWGGGGGAGEAGHNGTSNSHGNGGDGLYYGDLYSTGYGESGWFAGGGGGGGHDPAATYQGIGGTGGGGNGGTPGVNTPGEDGQDNTGGGGGGAATPSGGSGKGGDGGSGIVLVRYESTVDTSANASISSPATEEKSPAPIAYWKFDEGVGTTVYDSGSNHNNGVLAAGTSAPTWQTEDQCIAGKCLSFNGSTNYIDSNYDFSYSYNDSATISVWIKPTTVNTGSKVKGIIGKNATEFFITQYDDKIRIIHWNTVGSDAISILSDAGSIQANKWQYITYVYDGTAHKAYLYLNGIYHKQATPAYTDFTNAAESIKIGKAYGWGGSTTPFFDGFIDEPKIYSYARTVAQIKQDYNAGKANIAAAQGGNVNIGGTQTRNIKDNLIAHYKFDEGYGTTVHNTGTSGSAYDGTFAAGTSAPTWTTGKNGKGLSFDGTNDYVNLNTTFATKTYPFTFSAWVKPNTLTQDSVILNFDVNDANSDIAFGIYNTGNKILLGRNSSQVGLSGISTYLTAGKWQHWAIVFTDTTHISFYLDGIPKTLSTVSDYFSVSNSVTSIGSRVGDRFFNGLIDDVKIYNSALTADEVKLDYNQGAQFVMGKSNQTIGGTTTNLDYCIPGDTSACSAPVAEWKFEEGVGTTTYDTAGSNNGVLGAGNAAPIWAQGKIGKSMKFDGTDDYVKINNPSSLNFTENDSVSYSFWIKPFSFNNKSFPTIYNRGDQSSTVGYSWIHFMNGSNNISYHYTNGSGYTILTLGTSLPINQWTHVSINHNLGTKTVNTFVNGQLKDTDTYVNTAVGVSTGDSYIGIYQASSANFPFNGLIDNFRIYNYARTPAQIAYDYNKGAPIGHWKMDECEGNIVHDASGLGNTGTITIGAGGSQVSLGTCGAGDTTAWSNGSTGKINSAMSFDGTDDYINCGVDSTNFAMGNRDNSVAVWIYPKYVSNDYNYILSIGTSSTGHQLGLGLRSTSKIFLSAYSSPIVTTDYSIPSLNQWYHLVMSYNGGTDIASFYLNGNLIETESITLDTTLGYCKIGINGGLAANSLWNGFMDDVRVYNYALTSEQVKQIYNGGAVNFR